MLHPILLKSINLLTAISMLTQPILAAIPTEAVRAAPGEVEPQVISAAPNAVAGNSGPLTATIPLPAGNADSAPATVVEKPLSDSTTVEVPANRNGDVDPFDTGVMVTAGHVVHITAQGTWSFGLWCGSCWTSPDGTPNIWSGFTYLVQSGPYFGLVGRIGDGPWFFVGSDRTFVASQSGIMYLSMNDVYQENGSPVDGFADNGGAITATIDPEETNAPILARTINGSSAADCPCEHTEFATQSQTIASINTRTGNEAFSLTDISVPTQSGSLAFTRSYSTFNARDVASDELDSGSLGVGWYHNI